MPPQFNEDGTGEKPPLDQKKENAFYKGIGVGIGVFVGILGAIVALWYCFCKKDNAISEAEQDENSRYQGLASS